MGFAELLAEVNGLHEKGFRRWLFVAGMAFHDIEQWWGAKEQRAFPHEGVDFALYETLAGGQADLAAGADVPAAWAGEVACIHADFLGSTVWLRHGVIDGEGRYLYSVYGHLLPRVSLAVGESVAGREILGVVADSDFATGKKISSHLHFTVAQVSATVARNNLGWSLVHDLALVKLLDPNSV